MKIIKYNVVVHRYHFFWSYNEYCCLFLSDSQPFVIELFHLLVHQIIAHIYLLVLNFILEVSEWDSLPLVQVENFPLEVAQPLQVMSELVILLHLGRVCQIINQLYESFYKCVAILVKKPWNFILIVVLAQFKGIFVDIAALWPEINYFWARLEDILVFAAQIRWNSHLNNVSLGQGYS